MKTKTAINMALLVSAQTDVEKKRTVTNGLIGAQTDVEKMGKGHQEDLLVPKLLLARKRMVINGVELVAELLRKR